MAKVVLFISMSLDGYLADENGSIDWLSDVDIYEGDTTYDDFYKDVTSVILGRTTYDQITTELAVNNYPYSNVHSYVITRENRDNLNHVTFTNESVINLVRRLKEDEEGIIWTVGGSSLIQPLIENNLIDEYHIAIIPILLGNGIQLFKSFEGRNKLKLIDHYSKNDMVYLKYKTK